TSSVALPVTPWIAARSRPGIGRHVLVEGVDAVRGRLARAVGAGPSQQGAHVGLEARLRLLQVLHEGAQRAQLLHHPTVPGAAGPSCTIEARWRSWTSTRGSATLARMSVRSARGKSLARRSRSIEVRIRWFFLMCRRAVLAVPERCGGSSGFPACRVR